MYRTSTGSYDHDITPNQSRNPPLVKKNQPKPGVPRISTWDQTGAQIWRFPARNRVCRSKIAIFWPPEEARKFCGFGPQIWAFFLVKSWFWRSKISNFENFELLKPRGVPGRGVPGLIGSDRMWLQVHYQSLGMKQPFSSFWNWSGSTECCYFY